MWFAAAKVIISAGVIAFSSWLAGKRPDLAGFIIALPLATLLALPFAHMSFQDPENSIRFARSILVAVPLSLTFFVPFLLAGKLQWPFWALYVTGILCIGIAYAVHRFIMNYI